jgi:peptide/nickel transport system substrate-binding protein
MSERSSLQFAMEKSMKRGCLAGVLVLANSLLLSSSAWSDGVLRIGMTASDVPTTTGMPNNGFEGMRFLG